MKQNFQVPFFITAFDAQSQNSITTFPQRIIDTAAAGVSVDGKVLKRAKLDNHCDWLQDTECAGKSVVRILKMN